VLNLEPWKVESKSVHPVTGLPVYSLDSATGHAFIASIGSLEALDLHLQAAAERQAKEMKRIVEAYPNLAGSMVGFPDAPADQLLTLQLEVVEKLSGEEDVTALAAARQRLALLLALHQVRVPSYVFVTRPDRSYSWSCCWWPRRWIVHRGLARASP
jgi:hypothetical protein